MTDQDFLDWLVERLVVVYGENPNVDFVLKLKDIANRLGALVQAVEDQQRQLDGLDRSGWVGLLKCCSGPITKGGVRLHFDSCPDKCSAEVTRLRGEVAQLRADGQRLRDKFHDLSLELGDKECDFQSAAGRANAAEAELSRIRGLAAQATDAEIDAIITAGERWSRETVHDLGEVSRRQMVRHVLQAALAPPGDAP